jgi:DNA-binding XRE family transcriptional regulator
MNSTEWYSMTDSEIIMEIGKRIKILRMSENLTQQMMADQIGLNRSTMRDIEKGRSVNLLSIIPIFRRLNILDRIDDSIPNYEKSPVLAIQKNRKRVKLTKNHEPVS